MLWRSASWRPRVSSPRRFPARRRVGRQPRRRVIHPLESTTIIIAAAAAADAAACEPPLPLAPGTVVAILARWRTRFHPPFHPSRCRPIRSRPRVRHRYSSLSEFIIANASASLTGDNFSNAIFIFYRNDVRNISCLSRQFKAFNMISIILIIYIIILIIVIFFYDSDSKKRNQW